MPQMRQTGDASPRLSGLRQLPRTGDYQAEDEEEGE